MEKFGENRFIMKKIGRKRIFCGKKLIFRDKLQSLRKNILIL
jgi:hypothetical protein